MTADAISYLLCACGIRMIGGHEPQPPRPGTPRLTFRDLPDSWRYILTHAGLRPAFLNSLLTNSLILATEPVMAVLMLARLHFQPWQYMLAFGRPCVGGLIGSKLSRRLVDRFGQTQVMFVALWGAFASCVGLRAAIAAAGLLAVPTALLLPRPNTTTHVPAEPVQVASVPPSPIQRRGRDCRSAVDPALPIVELPDARDARDAVTTNGR